MELLQRMEEKMKEEEELIKVKKAHKLEEQKKLLDENEKKVLNKLEKEKWEKYSSKKILEEYYLVFPADKQTTDKLRMIKALIDYYLKQKYSGENKKKIEELMILRDSEVNEEKLRIK